MEDEAEPTHRPQLKSQEASSTGTHELLAILLLWFCVILFGKCANSCTLHVEEIKPDKSALPIYGC